MRHLTTEQLVDLAEGVETASSALHLQSCDACRRQLADLSGAMSVVAALDMPEPSPLFWNHFSARVHNAVTVERDQSPTLAGWGNAGFATLAAWLKMRSAAVGGLAVLVAAVAVWLQVGRLAPVFTPPSPASVIVDVPSDLASVVDDPSLSLVADLAADLDWEAAREAGLITHVGVDDDALSQLTAVERGELRRLLQGELSPSRRGA